MIILLKVMLIHGQKETLNNNEPCDNDNEASDNEPCDNEASDNEASGNEPCDNEANRSSKYDC